MIDESSLYKDNVAWKVSPHICETCGREGFRVSVFVGDTEILSGTNTATLSDAFDLIRSIKQSGIIREGNKDGTEEDTA